MKFILTFIILTHLQLAIAAEVKLLNFIQPLVLKSLSIEQSFEKDESLKVLGKPQKIQNETHFYELNGAKYPLSLEFKKGKLIHLFYRYQDQVITLDDVKLNLQKYKWEQKKDHRYDILNVPELKLQLKFKPYTHHLAIIERWYE